MIHLGSNSTNNFGTYNNNDLFNSNFFKLNLTEKKNNKSYIDSLIDNAYDNIPWLRGFKTKKTTLVDLSDLFTYEKPDYTLLDISPLALNLAWNKAATNLYEILYYAENPTYDFKIGGVPVKVFGNYIQIGSKILPKYTTSSMFSNMTKEEKVIIYNISLEINSITIAA